MNEVELSASRISRIVKLCPSNELVVRSFNNRSRNEFYTRRGRTVHREVHYYIRYRIVTSILEGQRDGVSSAQTKVGRIVVNADVLDRPQLIAGEDNV